MRPRFSRERLVAVAEPVMLVDGPPTIGWAQQSLAPLVTQVPLTTVAKWNRVAISLE
jgi:hypothetical protein